MLCKKNEEGIRNGGIFSSPIPRLEKLKNQARGEGWVEPINFGPSILACLPSLFFIR
jgi:hypothetical protein